MICVLQRVLRGEVRSAGEVIGRTGAGLVVLLGIEREDGPRECALLAQRLAQFRCFADGEGRMNRSALEVGAGILVVSQFTLASDTRAGRRPSFGRAAPPEQAEPLYLRFVEHLRALGLAVETGRFGAPMEVELVGDGPVTFVLEESARGRGQSPRGSQ